MRNLIDELETKLQAMKRLPSHREIALAITKLEESIMWLKAAPK